MFWIFFVTYFDAILVNTKYTEIGIAVKVDDYKGLDTLMAVQIFAKPASACSKPDGSKELINTRNGQACTKCDSNSCINSNTSGR